MSERLLQGLPASPGLGAGPARVLAAAPAGPAAPVPVEGRTRELARARAALAQAGAELARLGGALRGEGRAEDAAIVETGVLMAEDPALAAEVERAVLVAGRAAPEALVEAADALAALIAGIGDERLAARADDVRSLGRRAARATEGAREAATTDRAEPIEGPSRPAPAPVDAESRPTPAEAVEGPSRPTPAEPVVLVAAELGPADVAELGDDVAAVALAGGSPTAHAAVVARGLGIPMVVGLGDALLDARPGELVAIDGIAGSAALAPSEARLAAAREAAEQRRAEAARARAGSAGPCVTRDGHPLRVLVNAATAGELERGMDAGADGVGLLRTELAFLDATGWPSEEAHRSALAPLLGRLAGRTATVRVLDFGGDKTPPFLRGTELRGLALMLDAPEALAAQLRAIAAEGAPTDLRVLLPLAERAAQVEQVRALLPPSTRVGAMVETESAVSRAGELAAAADFLSIGTNDLTHAVLGTDRFATGAAATHDPRVLARLDTVARAAQAAGRALEVCGEAASDPILVPLLIGLGVDELSVGAARVAGVRELVGSVDRASAQELAQRALAAPDAAAVAELVDEAADAARERAELVDETADAARERVQGDRRIVPVSPQA